MAYVREKGRTVMVCRSYRKQGREACSPHRVWEAVAEKEIERGLREAMLASKLNGAAVQLLPEDYLDKVIVREDGSLSVFYRFQRPEGFLCERQPE